MGSLYSAVTVNNYNANPPSDDGSQTPENRINWSTIKSKLADTLKVAVDDTEAATVAAFNKTMSGAGVISTATSYEVVASDQGKLVKVTASATITTPDATEVDSPFAFSLLNLHSAAITLDGNGSQTINGSPSLSVAPGDGYQLYTDGSNWFATGRKTGILPRGYIDGCILSNGTDATNDINVAAGVCRDSTNAVDIAVAAMAGKQLDANWAAGAAAGMRYSGASVTNATYHIYAVAKADGTQDIYAYPATAGTDGDSSGFIATVLTALQAETGGASYIYARRLGSILRESAAIVLFVQIDDHFRRVALHSDAANNPGTSAVTRTLAVPVGVRVKADFLGGIQDTGGVASTYVLFTSLDQTDEVCSSAASSVSAAVSNIGWSPLLLWTDLSGQIRSRVNISDSSTTARWRVHGWYDLRGKDA